LLVAVGAVNGRGVVAAVLGVVERLQVLRFLPVQQLLLLLAVVVQEAVIKAPCLPLVLIQFFLLSLLLVVVTVDTTALVVVLVVLVAVALRVRREVQGYRVKEMPVVQAVTLILAAAGAALLLLVKTHPETLRVTGAGVYIPKLVALLLTMQVVAVVDATWLMAVLLQAVMVAEEQVALMIAAPQVTVQQEQTTLVVGVGALAV
jgi:hypothetical protein